MEHLRLWLKERPGIPWEISWVVLLALTLRVIAFWRFDPVAFDSAIYFEMADLIRAGHWSTVLTYDYPPLYPLFVATAQWFLRDWEIAGVLVSLAADVFVIFPLFAIARTTVGYSGAWGAVFLWAIHPLAIGLGVQALSDAPTAALVAVSIWAGLHALEHRRLAWALTAGIASGLAHLLRPEGIEPALSLAAIYWWPVSKLGAPSSASPEIQSTWGSGFQTVRRRTLRSTAWVVAPLVGWALVASPYIISISEQSGALTLSKKKSAVGFARSLAGEGMPTVLTAEPCCPTVERECSGLARVGRAHFTSISTQPTYHERLCLSETARQWHTPCDLDLDHHRGMEQSISRCGRKPHRLHPAADTSRIAFCGSGRASSRPRG